MKEQKLLRVSKITETLDKLIFQLTKRSNAGLLFTLSPKIYRQLNNEANAKRLGTRPCEIHTFIGQYGRARILEGKDQSDNILVYRRGE